MRFAAPSCKRKTPPGGIFPAPPARPGFPCNAPPPSRTRGKFSNDWKKFPMGLSGETPAFCMLRPAGRGRPPGGPPWAILPHGPPGGRALPAGGPNKKSQGFRPATPMAGNFSIAGSPPPYHLRLRKKLRFLPVFHHLAPMNIRPPASWVSRAVQETVYPLFGGAAFQPRLGLGDAARQDAAPPEVAQDLLNKRCTTSGGAASCRAAGWEIMGKHVFHPFPIRRPVGAAYLERVVPSCPGCLFPLPRARFFPSGG